MVKKDHFNIIMAGVISGIVAITTATLGVSGTVIGSVLSSILYQILSKYSEQKIDNAEFPSINVKSNTKIGMNSVNLGGEIVFLFPIIVIALIECVFVFSEFLYPLARIFHLLEYATDQNLFKVMGLGMILLSFYPFLKSNNLRKGTGFLVLFAGLVFLLRGFVDSGFLISRVAAFVFARFDFWIGLFLLFILLVIIVYVISDIFSNRSDRKNNFKKQVVPNKVVNENVNSSKSNFAGKVSSNSSNTNLNFFDKDFDE